MKNPFLTIWKIISVPLSALGLLGLSDALVKFHENIQNIIDSYQSIVYPPFRFLFGWLPFDVPEPLFDYLFLGFLYSSNERKVFGSLEICGRYFEYAKVYFMGFTKNVLFWPVMAGEKLWQMSRSRKDGLIESLTKGPKPIYVKYNYRDDDFLLFRYIGATILIFIIVLIINYTLLLRSP